MGGGGGEDGLGGMVGVFKELGMRKCEQMVLGVVESRRWGEMLFILFYDDVLFSFLGNTAKSAVYIIVHHPGSKDSSSGFYGQNFESRLLSFLGLGVLWM